VRTVRHLRFCYCFQTHMFVIFQMPGAQEVLICGSCLAVLRILFDLGGEGRCSMTALTLCDSCTLRGAGDPRGVNDIWLLASEETVRLLS
jgi:hypothetical protein